MRDWKPALLALAIVLTGAAGRAAGQERAENRGPYLELHGGVNLADGEIADSGGLYSTVFGRSEFKNGSAVGGAAGYKWPHWRLEGELTYRRNGFDEIDWVVTDKDGTFETDGTVSSFAVMANVFWDIPIGSTGIVPTLGTGIGLATVIFDDVSDADGPLFDEIEAGLAFHMAGGLGYEVTDSITLLVEYRAFAAFSINPRIGSNQPEVGGKTANMLYLNRTVWLGMRHRF